MENGRYFLPTLRTDEQDPPVYGGGVRTIAEHHSYRHLLYFRSDMEKCAGDCWCSFADLDTACIGMTADSTRNVTRH